MDGGLRTEERLGRWPLGGLRTVSYCRENNWILINWANKKGEGKRKADAKHGGTYRIVLAQHGRHLARYLLILFVKRLALRRKVCDAQLLLEDLSLLRCKIWARPLKTKR